MATTINNYSVGLTLNAGQYFKGVEMARGETSKLTRTISELQSPAEKAANRLALMEKAFAQMANPTQHQIELLRRMRQRVEELNRPLSETPAKASRASSALGSLAKAYAALQVGRLVKDSVNLYVQLEQSSARFEILTGSAENAANMLAKLRSDAARSPITFMGYQQGAQTLLQFGVQASKVNGVLNQLNDVSGGNEERFKSLALAFGQMSAAGRLMGQDVLQMINAGFNPLQEISKTTGESMIALKKRMEDGAISSQEVADAFNSATSAGGLYSGMADKLAETTGGKMAIATSQLQEAMTELGEVIAPLIIDLVEGFEKGEGAIRSALNTVEKMVDGFRFMVALGKDAGETIAAAFNGELVEDSLKATNKLLDELEQRDKVRAQEEGKTKVVGEVVDKEVQKSTWADYFQNIQDQAANAFSELNKMAEELERKDEQLRSRALVNAQRYFEEQRQAQMMMRGDIASGMGQAGFQSGSAESVRFRADQINKQIADRTTMPQAAPTEEQILAKAKEQYEELKKQTGEMRSQARQLDKLIAAVEDNMPRNYR